MFRVGLGLNLMSDKVTGTATADGRSFLVRLARDRTGNAAAFMAAALMPLAAFTGAALDTARLYAVKVRLQQSCDAGALAGRKMMTGSSLDQASKDHAQAFFKSNFKTGWFRTADVTFVPEDTADGQVKGTANAKVPVTIMSMFGAGPTDLSVTCEARKEIGDVDVMFVLDTTGSMACVAGDSESTCNNYTVANAQKSGGSWSVTEKSGSRINAIRSAVITFYDTLDAAADASSRIRYGVVPYSSSVNLGGGVLPTSYMVDEATYPSRYVHADQATGSVTTVNTPRVASASCPVGITRSVPFPQYPATKTDQTWASATVASGNAPGICTTRTQSQIPLWRYKDVTVNVSSFKAGNSVTQPVSDTGEAVGWVNGVSSTWDGCILERKTTGASSFSASSPPPDLDINLAATDDDTKWKPAWLETIFDRTNIVSEDTASSDWPGSTNVKRHRVDDNQHRYQQYACPKRAKRLSAMSKTELQDFVKASNGFKPQGYTYHDVGMVWGARFLTPNGIFKADTDCRAGRTCGRHLVFMTDGDMNPNQCAYSAQGFERLEGRVMGSKPVSTCTTTSYNYAAGAPPASLETRHNARFQAICTQAKNEGITIWVVAYAQAMTTDLRNCASNSSTAIEAPTDQKLQDAFKQIAGKIAELRISK